METSTDRGRWWPRSVVGCAVAAVFWPSCVASVPSPPPIHVVRAVARHGWVVQNQAFGKLLEFPSSRRMLRTWPTFVIKGTGKVHRLDSSLVTRKFTSRAAFARTLARHGLGRDVRAVLYDPESWAATPKAEQRAVAANMKRFVTLAHRHHLIAIVTPALDLVPVLDPRGRGPYPARYLALGIPRAAARSGADVVVVQAQSQQSDPIRYAGFVAAAAWQVRSVSTRTRTFAGLSTGPTGIRTDAAMLGAAATAAAALVDGFWLNAPGGSSAQCPACTGGSATLLRAVTDVLSVLWR